MEPSIVNNQLVAIHNDMADIKKSFLPNYYHVNGYWTVGFQSVKIRILIGFRQPNTPHPQEET
jgi:hypothetical protein